MKNIQAGFLTLPTLTRLPILSPELVEGSMDSGFLVKALTPNAWGRDYSGGSAPDFSIEVESRGSLYLDVTVYTILFNKIVGSLSSFLYEPKKFPLLAGGGEGGNQMVFILSTPTFTLPHRSGMGNCLRKFLL